MNRVAAFIAVPLLTMTIALPAHAQAVVTADENGTAMATAAGQGGAAGATTGAPAYGAPGYYPVPYAPYGMPYAPVPGQAGTTGQPGSTQYGQPADIAKYYGMINGQQPPGTDPNKPAVKFIYKKPPGPFDEANLPQRLYHNIPLRRY